MRPVRRVPPLAFFKRNDRFMETYLQIIVATVLVNNVVLVKVLGLCPVAGIGRKLEASLAVGAATAFVLTLACGAGYLLDEYLLEPFDLQYLRVLSFLLLIAGAVGFTDLMLLRTSPLLHRTLGIHGPLAAANCAVLGIPLLNLQEHHNFIESLFYGFGSGAGFVLVLVLFAGLRERLRGAEVPRAFQGSAIAMVTAGLMSLAFMGFAGLVK